MTTRAIEKRRRIGIVGARPAQNGSTGWDSWVRLCVLLDTFVAGLPDGVVIVSGGAAGIDSRAAKKARDRLLEVVEFFPDYARHGSRAPLVRNTLIADGCDELHAFPAVWSRGTWDTYWKAQDRGVPTTKHGDAREPRRRR